jgi:hypothetical protein
LNGNIELVGEDGKQREKPNPPSMIANGQGEDTEEIEMSRKRRNGSTVYPTEN